MSQRRQSERNRMILDILMARPYSTFKTLTKEIIEFDRSKMDLVSKMKDYDCDGDDNLPFLKIMDISSHTIRLQKNFKILVNELATTNTIVDHLISDEVLGFEDQAEICASDITKEQRNRRFLTKLIYKNDDTYTHFLSALKEDTYYEQLARHIENTVVTEEDKIKIHISNFVMYVLHPESGEQQQRKIKKNGQEIAESMNKSSRNGHNISQLVKDMEKPVIFYDWKKYLQQYFKTLKHISTYHHFIVDSTKPGYVVFKESCDSVPITINLLKRTLEFQIYYAKHFNIKRIRCSQTVVFVRTNQGILL
ncbi:unnamed protein product [Mytilus edulis]|uniref:CARD domain-containing protein n=1 Tax=Mytilus edulis TaxID=6550 RepID=A0A8S3PTK9_MYTED|nr:unnamed protein product [Mytilus edulis]